MAHNPFMAPSQIVAGGANPFAPNNPFEHQAAPSSPVVLAVRTHSGSALPGGHGNLIEPPGGCCEGGCCSPLSLARYATALVLRQPSRAAAV
jgi:hypothetical protein